MSFSTLKILPFTTVNISPNTIMIYAVFLPKAEKPEFFICKHPTIRIILQDQSLINLIERLKK
jgi:hypothetical protein